MIIRPATLKDAHYLAVRLRQADRAEIAAASGQDPKVLLPVSFEASTVCNTITKKGDDRPIAMYGIVRETEDQGIIWMLCSARINEVSLSLLKRAPSIVRQLQKVIPNLHNLVHAKNTQAIRWIEAAGFAFSDVRRTPKGAFFLHFHTKE